MNEIDQYSIVVMYSDLNNNDGKTLEIWWWIWIEITTFENDEFVDCRINNNDYYWCLNHSEVTSSHCYNFKGWQSFDNNRDNHSGFLIIAIISIIFFDNRDNWW